MKKIFYTLAVAATMFVVGCKSDDFSGEYKVSSISFEKELSEEEQKIMDEQFEIIKTTCKFVFKDNGQLEETGLDGIKLGSWELLGTDEKQLKFVYEDKSSVIIKIKDITDNGFSIVNDGNVIVYEKVKE